MPHCLQCGRKVSKEAHFCSVRADLGFSTQPATDGMRVTVPSWALGRPDLLSVISFGVALVLLGLT